MKRIAAAIALLILCVGCAHRAPAEDERPTYWQCREQCLFKCDGNICDRTGLRPTGVDEHGRCRCGGWDA